MSRFPPVAVVVVMPVAVTVAVVVVRFVVYVVVGFVGCAAAAPRHAHTVEITWSKLVFDTHAPTINQLRRARVRGGVRCAGFSATTRLKLEHSEDRRHPKKTELRRIAAQVCEQPEARQGRSGCERQRSARPASTGGSPISGA